MIKNVRDLEIVKDIETEIPYEKVKSQKPLWGNRLARNCAITALLLITVSSVRNNQLPSGETVLNAIQTLSGEGWDASLGKISFVSHMIPDTVDVFGNAQESYSVSAPSQGKVTHAWSKEEPYLSFYSADGKVYAVDRGQIMSTAHGMDDEIILRVRQDNGLETIYYDLQEIAVAEGDIVEKQDYIGKLLTGKQASVEIRKNGITQDPTAWFSSEQNP